MSDRHTQLLGGLLARLPWRQWHRALVTRYQAHPRLWIFNGVFVLACLIVLATTMRFEGRLTYEMTPQDEMIVIVDIGHGGRDPGATVQVDLGTGSRQTVHEHALVFDVGARLVRLLEAQEDVAVLPLLTAEDGSLPISEDPVPKLPSRTILRSTPPMDLRIHSNIEAVNMRWLLANEFNALAREQSVSQRSVLYLSLHMDQVPNRTGGLTIYVPPGRPEVAMGMQVSPYIRFEEVQSWFERPTVWADPTLDVVESTLLAQLVVDGFERHGLPICPDRTIRNWIRKRDGDYVPAVLRYNQVTTRLLLELVNLASRRDRQQVLDADYRERIAMAIYEGILELKARAGSRPEGELERGVAGHAGRRSAKR